MMIEYIDENGRKRTAPNGRNQYLGEAVGVFPPNGENWHLADEWSKNLAAKLIAIGWPNVDIEEHKREAKELPAGIKRSDEAKGRLHAYSYFENLANIAIQAGHIKESDSPAHWLEWAKSKGYETGHLTKYMGKTMSDNDAALFARIGDMLEPYLKPIDYEQAAPTYPPSTDGKPLRTGRPPSIRAKAEIVRQIVVAFEQVAETQFNPGALPGKATDLLDACQRIEKSLTGKTSKMMATQEAFKDWLRTAGYSFPNGRTPKDQETFWTHLAPAITGKISAEVFTGVIPEKPL